MAVCPVCSITRSKDKAGWFDISFEFRRDDGIAGGPFVSALIFERVLAGIAGTVAGVFGSLFGEQMQTGAVLDFVVDNAAGRIQTFAADMLTQVQAAPVESTAAIVADIDGLRTAAFDILRPPADQVPGVFCSDVTFVKPDVPYYSMENAFRDSGAATALALSVADIMGRVMDALPPEQAIVASQSLTSFAIAEAPPTLQSKSCIADSVNATLFNGHVRVQACIQWARAVSQAPYRRRSDAVNARAAIVSIMNAEIDNLGTNGEAVQAVIEARDLCAKMLSDQILSLASTITVYAPQSMPALYWANRLYEDVNRAQEIADGNDASNYSFMPMRFSALAS